MKWHLVNNLVLGKYSMCDSWVRPLSVHKFSRPYQGVANRELEIATLSIQMQPKEQYLYHACVLRAHLTANTSASNHVRFYGRLRGEGGGAYVKRTVALNVKFRERPRFCFPAGNCGLVRLDEVFGASFQPIGSSRAGHAYFSSCGSLACFPYSIASVEHQAQRQ